MGDDEEAAAIADFYDEYFAVLDIAAEFYLETIDRVFQRELLARGELTWRGQPVELAAIRRTALLTVEGEKDDVCGVGQTLAAQDLCTGHQAGEEAASPAGRRRPLRGVQREPLGAPDLPDRAQLHSGQSVTPPARRLRRWRPRSARSELHLEFLDVVGLELGRRGPLDHLRQWPEWSRRSRRPRRRS